MTRPTLPATDRAFTSWLLEPHDGVRDVTDVEMDYLRARLAGLRCPFCRRSEVDLVQGRCVCHETRLTLACGHADCRGTAVVPEAVITMAHDPAHAARRLRAWWRVSAVRVVVVHPDTTQPRDQAGAKSGGGLAERDSAEAQYDRDATWDPNGPWETPPGTIDPPEPMEPPRPWSPEDDYPPMI